MALSPLRDLTPTYDAKGGNPRTPSGGIPVQEYQQFALPINGNGVWKAIATGMGGLVCGLLLAWFTAYQGKGITQKEVQDYVKEYDTTQLKYMIEHNSQQDLQIGNVQGIQQRNIERLNAHDVKFHDEDRDISDLQSKVKLFGDFVNEVGKAKK